MSVDHSLEDELRAAIAELAAEARSTARVLSALQRPAASRWRRLAPIGSAVAVLVVAAIVLVLTLGRTADDESAPPAGPRPADVCPVPATAPFTTFTLDPKVATSDSAFACAGVRVQTLTHNAGTVLLYGPGVFVASGFTHEQPVRGAQISGFTGSVDMPPIGDCSTAVSSCARRAFAWQYAPDSWGVVVSSTARSTAALERIAAAVRPDEAVPVRFPAMIAALPHRLSVMDVHEEYVPPVRPIGQGAPVARVELRSAGVPCSPYPGGGECRPTVSLEIGANAGPGGGISGAHVTRTRINGADVEIEPGSGDSGAFAAVATATCAATLESAPGVTESVLVRLIKAVRFVPDCSQPQTWPSADDALPH